MDIIQELELNPFDFHGMRYAISREGDVYSLNRNHYGKRMSQHIDRAGYRTVKLIKNGKGSTQYIHKLLAINLYPIQRINPWLIIRMEIKWIMNCKIWNGVQARKM